VAKTLKFRVFFGIIDPQAYKIAKYSRIMRPLFEY